MALDFAADLALVMAPATSDLPLVTGVYAQGANTKADVSAARTQRTRAGAPNELDQDVVELVMAQAMLATGFSGTNPVRPSRNDTLAISGEVVWRVETVDELGLGAGWTLTCSRRRGAGVA